MTARHVLTIVAVPDLDRAVRFYQAAFGWNKQVDTPVYVELDAGKMRFGVYQRDGFAKNIGRHPEPTGEGALVPVEIYLEVDELDRSVERALAAGARLLSPRSPRPWGDDVAYVADPDGIVIALAVHSVS
jgi:predicted enzyme related to lactoylglutathione lyase